MESPENLYKPLVDFGTTWLWNVASFGGVAKIHLHTYTQTYTWKGMGNACDIAHVETKTEKLRKTNIHFTSTLFTK